MHVKHSPSDPPAGTTIAAIRACASSLAPSERRVADVCVERPAEVAWWSAADLAEHASTSTATVIRACQNLGFKGFQHLRMLLLRDLGAATSADAGVGVQGATGVGLMRSVFDEVAQDLGAALAPLDAESFDKAVRELGSSRRLLIVANGGSAPAAAAIAFRFVTNGRSAEAPADAIVQQLTARHLGKSGLCLAISDSGMNAYTLQSVSAAKASGATVIAVTSYARSALVEQADIALVIGGGVGPWSGHGASSPVVQLSFLVGLQIAVAEAGSGSAQAAAQTLEQVVALLNPSSKG
ncbi:RpiR family transcriptional regulator [Rhodococcus sp. SRB_17]|nr:RpiR family transcriptional regulator [Rhodococcus sp. SRB_17]